MKVVKGIGLFFVYPMLFLIIGFVIGMSTDNYFYPNDKDYTEKEIRIESSSEPETSTDVSVASVSKDVITTDTAYIIEEYDTVLESLVETEWKVPEKYLGMDRETFQNAMDSYSISPPLSELERGFIGLEIVSFSGKRVVVRMNYIYNEQNKSYYLYVTDHKVVVYCEDKKTVYMHTDIDALTLPEYIRNQIMMGMYIEDEETLYHFLETYTS